MTDSRHVWLTDRYGAALKEDVTVDRLDRLLDTIEGDDDDQEHRSISLSDEDEWNLEFYPDRVTFENVERGGEVVGRIEGATRAELLVLGSEFIAGDLDAVRAHPWKRHAT